MNELKGRVALITGSGRGFGSAIAERLGEAGADLILNYRTSRVEAEDLAESHRRRGGRALAVQADVTDRPAVARMVDAATSEFGGLDILVNNAGVLDVVPFLQSSDERRRQEIEVNVFGVMNVTEMALPAIVNSRHGRIINISSHIALGGWEKAPVYAGTKGFVLSWTKSLAKEVGVHDVTVNAIGPGGILTDMNAGIFSNESERAERVARSPLKRFGDPRDVAEVALFLASDAANYITGQLIMPNGGAVM